MNIERAFLTSVIDTGGMKQALEERITFEFFQDEEDQEVWVWLVDFYNEHLVTPSSDVLGHHFPNFELEETFEEPLAYFVDELRNLRKKKLLQEAISGTREFYDENLVDDAVKWLAKSIQEIHEDTSVIRDIDFTEGAEMWLDEYIEQVKSGGWFKGIPSGFPFIDNALGGLQGGQLITIVGMPKAGKSTALLWSCICAHAAAYKTTFTTFEMSNEEQRLRHHTFRANINYNRLKFGKLKPVEARRLRKMLNGLSGMQPMVFVQDPSSTTTVAAIAAKLQEHKPEIAYIDGTYLMDCGIPGVLPNSPQALTAITRDLKRLAQRMNIPIVNTTQVLPSKYSARTGIRLGDIGYTSSFAQDSDAIFGAETDPDDSKYMIISVVAARNAPPGKARYIIDWETGSIEEVEEPDFEKKDDDQVDE